MIRELRTLFGLLFALGGLACFYFAMTAALARMQVDFIAGMIQGIVLVFLGIILLGIGWNLVPKEKPLEVKEAKVEAEPIEGYERLEKAEEEEVTKAEEEAIKKAEVTYRIPSPEEYERTMFEEEKLKKGKPK